MMNEMDRQRQIDAVIRRAVEEDVGNGDVTSHAAIPADANASGRFVAKADGTLSGTAPATRTFQFIDAGVTISWHKPDGDSVSANEEIGRVSGNARSILAAERTALNILQRMSGIATMTARMAAEVKPFGTRILDTRKTAPGLRVLDKMAVADGGGLNHRFGLYDMILIKDNHIVAAGSVRQALQAADVFRAGSDEAPPIEIEARTLEEVEQILSYWEERGVPDRILLDNMARRLPEGQLETGMLREAVALIDGRIETEASGNIELSTVREIARTGVDYISSGALTHSVVALDVSLEFALDRP